MEYTVGSTTSTYYFHRNLLGDVVGIYDTSGALVAKYLYDAWGNCTISSETTNNALAHANPIRYRGYYYDDDTGLYYCNARYYSPKWYRFISPDDTAYLDPESVNGLNLYCYCGNNPVCCIDPTGRFPWLAFIIIAAFVITGGVYGATYDGRLIDRFKGENNTDEVAENQPITFWDRVVNVLLGMAVGLAVGGAVVMLTSIATATVVGATVSTSLLGGTALQSFAIGALAFDFYAMCIAPFLGIEVEPVEFTTTEIPY